MKAEKDNDGRPICAEEVCLHQSKNLRIYANLIGRSTGDTPTRPAVAQATIQLRDGLPYGWKWAYYTITAEKRQRDSRGVDAWTKETDEVKIFKAIASAALQPEHNRFEASMASMKADGVPVLNDD